MADTDKKYLDFAGLKYYDGKIKTWVEENFYSADAAQEFLQAYEEYKSANNTTIEGINTAIDGINTAIGDKNGGLVKDIADNASAIESIQALWNGFLDGYEGDGAPAPTLQKIKEFIADMVGDDTDSNKGRVGVLEENVADNASAIADINTTIGDAEGGMVKDIADNKAAIDEIKETLGDADGGLAKAIADNAAAIEDINTAIEGEGGINATLSSHTQSIADNAAAIEDINTTIGDDNGGMKKDIADNASDIADINAAITGDGGINAQLSSHAQSIADNASNIATNTADITTLKSQITGLTGAVHFKGVVTEVPTDLEGYADGDIIVISGSEATPNDNGKEYILADGEWVELGDTTAELAAINEIKDTIGDENGGLVKDIADNKAAIEAFKRISEAEIDGLFAEDEAEA